MTAAKTLDRTLHIRIALAFGFALVVLCFFFLLSGPAQSAVSRTDAGQRRLEWFSHAQPLGR